MKRDEQTWHEQPSRPTYVPPPGAVDAHCHVFGPGDIFPYAPQRKYTPADAPKELLYLLRRHLGFSRSVLVQASCHGNDNSAMLDAIRTDFDNTRGVAVVDVNISDNELDELHRGGVRGVRFNFLKRLVEPQPFDVLHALSRRVADRGWHVVVYFEIDLLLDIHDFLKSIPTTVVIDHMGRPDVGEGTGGAMFSSLLHLMQDEKFWIKVGCPERLSIEGPPYDDVAPFAKRLVGDFEDRVLWGTDWPHPNMESHIPDDGLLVDRIPVIAPLESQRQKLLVDNPTRLYWG